MSSWRCLKHRGSVQRKCWTVSTVVTDCSNAVEHLWVSRKSQQGRPCFCCGCRRNYMYTCTVKPYDILIVRNALVKSVFFTVYSPVHCGECSVHLSCHVSVCDWGSGCTADVMALFRDLETGCAVLMPWIPLSCVCSAVVQFVKSLSLRAVWNFRLQTVAGAQLVGFGAFYKLIAA